MRSVSHRTFGGGAVLHVHVHVHAQQLHDVE